MHGTKSHTLKEVGKFTIIVRDFNIPISATDRTTREKISIDSELTALLTQKI